MNSRITRTLVGSPSRSVYHRLLDWLGGVSSSLLLVKRAGLEVGPGALTALGLLSPHLQAKDRANAWPGTALVGEEAELFYFRMSDVLIAHMKSMATSLYDWQQPDLLEDPCFLRDTGEPILITVSHEEYAELVLTETELAALRALVPQLRLASPS